MPASYESDSSDGEFEETNVLLGYASKDADEDTISHLGGYPVINPVWKSLEKEYIADRIIES